MSYEPEFTFSGSKYGKFKTCQFMFYLHYYESKDGWNYTPESLKYKIWKLKRLYPMPAWIGVFVHEHIAKYINMHFRKGKVDDIKFRDLIQTEYQEWFSMSEKGCFNKMKHPVLPEHHYKIASPEFADEVLHSIMDKFEVFYDKVVPFLSTIDPDTVLTVDVEDFSQYFYIDGIKMYSIVDFAYYSPKKQLIQIIDWKTGKWESENSEQLRMYAMYYLDYYKDDYELTYKNFNLREFNLTEAAHEKRPI